VSACGCAGVHTRREEGENKTRERVKPITNENESESENESEAWRHTCARRARIPEP
jgi:hypothetical protein